MKKNPALRIAMVWGSVTIMGVGVAFFLSGDRTFGGLLVLGGIVELVALPFIVKRMEEMNR